jgi:hypothetical protein
MGSGFWSGAYTIKTFADIHKLRKVLSLPIILDFNHRSESDDSISR